MRWMISRYSGRIWTGRISQDSYLVAVTSAGIASPGVLNAVAAKALKSGPIDAARCYLHGVSGGGMAA